MLSQAASRESKDIGHGTSSFSEHDVKVLEQRFKSIIRLH